ncbi:MAG: hypothetical protein RL238_2765 [Actinomycetota bacterium]
MADQPLPDLEPWYRLVAEHVIDVVLLLAPDNHYLWVSPSIVDVLGWQPEEVVGRSFRDFVRPDDQERVLQARRDAPGGTAQLDEFEVRCADGSYRWLSSRSTAVTLPDGTPGRVVALRDVHDAVLARRALAESDAQFRLLAEHASDVVCLAGPDHRLRWVSPTIEHTLGWSPDELIGMTLTDLAHPDDRPSHDAAREALYEPHPDGLALQRFLGRLRAKDGSYRWMSGTAQPELDEQGDLKAVVAGLRDVSDLIAARVSAERQAELVHALMDAVGDAIIVYDRDARLQYVNQRAAVLSGLPIEEMTGRALSEVGRLADHRGPLPDFVHSLLHHLAEVFSDGRSLDFEFCVALDEAPRWFHTTLSPVVGADGSIAMAVSTSRDVTERHHVEEDLTRRATRDQLTGLANRAVLLDEIARALAAAERTGRATAVLMIDLDHFKAVNDSLGHDVGDQLLIAAARRLESTVRSGDVAGRLGGDEFVVVMRDLDVLDDATQLAQRIVDIFRTPFSLDRAEVTANASVGVATASELSTDDGDLLRDADAALYLAKHQGRDRHAVYTESVRHTVTDRLTLSTELRPAFERNEFEVWYQPCVDLATNRVVALEALLRWRHRSGELLDAHRFIDVADEAGVLTDIGEWVLWQACRHAANWTHDDSAPLTMCVNLSASQLAEPRLLAAIDEALSTSGLPAGQLCLELSEASLLREQQGAAGNLVAIRERGIRVSIDDFGTGNASLACLREIPVDAIKIDRGFVADLGTDERDRRIVAGIVALADQLGVAVTAEGVEDQEQAEALRAIHCDTAQGFLFSRPMPAQDVADYLARALLPC